MEIFAGFVLCLFVELLLWGAYRMNRRTLPPAPPQRPQTPGQRANEAAHEAQEAATPRVVNLRLQRRRKRGGRREIEEREYDPFD